MTGKNEKNYDLIMSLACTNTLFEGNMDIINNICNLVLHISSKIYDFEKLLEGAFEPL